MAPQLPYSKFVIFCCFLIKVSAVISGQITPDQTEIQLTASYTFLLNFQSSVSPTTAKIVIRFPSDYTSSFITECAPILGFTGTNLTCTYLQTSRILTLTGTAFPPTTNQLRFTVLGIVNPDTVRTTGSFFVSAYYLSGTSFVLKETGGSGIQITTTSGAISSQTLTLSDPTVGVYSDLTLQLTTTHVLPSNGQIKLALPKWNSQDPVQANWVSVVSVPIAPGPVSCFSQYFLHQITCYFQSGQSQDTIVIQLYESANIQAQTNIQIVINNFRAPPSLTPLSGFSISTMTNSGQMIDQWKSQMQLTATKAFDSSSSILTLIVSPTTISVKSSVQLTIQNTNPLLAGSEIQITVPQDFNITQSELRITLSGQYLVSQPTFIYSGRIIKILAFNTAYLQPLSVSYINIIGLTNPAQTARTASFQVIFYDPQNQPVEFVNAGITMEATPGTFSSASVTAQNLQISAVNVYYTFTLLPQHSFSSFALLKLTFPADFWVNPSGYIVNQSSNMGPTPQIKTLYNSEVYITKAFPNGYIASQPIKFTLTGITNPNTVTRSQPIKVSVFYDEDFNQIDNYSGSGMTITAQPAPVLSISVELSNPHTGQINDQLTITGSTPFGRPIVQGASLLVFIPSTFIITDPTRVASSCAIISGFSDQITCYFVETSTQSGSYLVVTQGFSSDTFSGGSFSFSISEVMNPFNSARSKPFTMEIYDSLGQLSYEMNPTNDPFTLYVFPTSFAFVFITSNSSQNGDSSIYDFSITLNIDTPSGTTLQVILPNELQFDTSKSFLCNGTLALVGDITCYYRNGRSINIVLMPNQHKSLVQSFVFKNGTTIGFTLGLIFNSFSLAPTGSFGISTFTLTGNQGTEYIYINQQLSGLKITNEIPGLITVNNITQTGSKELNQKTIIKIDITTTNTIPVGAELAITLPTNFKLKPSLTVIINNRVATDAQINTNTLTLTSKIISSTGQKNFLIIINSGLVNPDTGPYEYNQFGFQFSYNSYAIDTVLSNQTWISVQCGGNCTACQGTLNGCQKCGLLGADSFFLYKKQCLSLCPPGFYGGSGYDCLKCQSPCAECNIGAEMCTRCDPTKSSPFVALSTMSCYNQCPTGTYLNTALSQCVLCESPCYSCSSATQCLTCDLNNPFNNKFYFFSQNNTCLESCPPVSVPSPSKVCVDCESPCKTCTESPDNCLSCVQGLYFYKNQCVSNCPFNYFSDNTSMQCKAIASLKIPFPFTIIAFVISCGVGLASFMKGNHKTGEGTAFFITCIAFVDILLRVNWFVLGVMSLQQGYYYIFLGCAVILAVSLFLNLGVWRRFFKFKYNLDDNDSKFVKYSQEYPRTSKWIIFVSNAISFQAFRLSYSRFLGKKQFFAEFTRSRVYVRLIGRLSIMAIMFLYLPAILINIYGLTYDFKMGDQIFYIGLDSLTLVAYASVLIVVTLTQREKLLDQKELFRFGELCRCDVPSDDEIMYQNDDDNQQGKRRKNPANVMGTFEEDSQDGSARFKTQHLDEIELDVMSATGYDEIRKQKLYQTELRKENKTLGVGGNLLDYNKYKDLQEKVNRIVLKRNLYENRRMNDYEDLQNRRSDLSTALQHNEVLLDQVRKLRIQMQYFQSQIQLNELPNQKETTQSHTSAPQQQIKQQQRVTKQKKSSPQMLIYQKKKTSETSPHIFTLNSVQTQHEHLFNLNHQNSTEGDLVQEQRSRLEAHDSEPITTTIQERYQEIFIGTTESHENEEDSILREFGQQRQSFGPDVDSSQ